MAGILYLPFSFLVYNLKNLQRYIVAFSKLNRPHTLNGLLFVFLLSFVAFVLSQFSFFIHLAISPLVIGIVLGMMYANSLRIHLPKEWDSGIHFCTKTLLRLGIILYGFRITFTQIQSVGVSGFMASILVVSLTLFLGYFIGVKLLKLDFETAILTSAGSAICGAAAVLAAEGVLKNESYKSAVAVGTVVLFGTVAMFLYPLLYQLGWIPLDFKEEGIYIGATIHEVAQVVGAGSAISQEVATNAVIVKMIRVMLLVPVLIILGFVVSKFFSVSSEKKMVVPWFAVYFIVVAGFNSLNLLPLGVVEQINLLDTFILTMAMTALGMETSFAKFKGVGGKAMLLALILFIWLIVGGFFITKFCTLYM